jgi:hypothetical protein
MRPGGWGRAQSGESMCSPRTATGISHESEAFRLSRRAPIPLARPDQGSVESAATQPELLDLLDPADANDRAVRPDGGSPPETSRPTATKVGPRGESASLSTRRSAGNRSRRLQHSRLPPQRRGTYRGRWVGERELRRYASHRRLDGDLQPRWLSHRDLSPMETSEVAACARAISSSGRPCHEPHE